jgi:hypothetical protein
VNLDAYDDRACGSGGRPRSVHYFASRDRSTPGSSAVVDGLQPQVICSCGLTSIPAVTCMVAASGIAIAPSLYLLPQPRVGLLARNGEPRMSFYCGAGSRW